MNITLNNLALLSFKRKARKLGKNIEVANLTDQGFFEEYLVRAGETLIIWGEENGFHLIFTENDRKLACLVNFPDKYGYDEVYHFGILNPDKTKLFVYRCYDQYEKSVFGLQFRIDEYLESENFQDDQMSHVTSLLGRASCG